MHNFLFLPTDMHDDSRIIEFTKSRRRLGGLMLTSHHSLDLSY